jgi:hypothetical protein
MLGTYLCRSEGGLHQCGHKQQCYASHTVWLGLWKDKNGMHADHPHSCHMLVVSAIHTGSVTAVESPGRLQSHRQCAYSTAVAAVGAHLLAFLWVIDVDVTPFKAAQGKQRSQAEMQVLGLGFPRQGGTTTSSLVDLPPPRLWASCKSRMFKALLLASTALPLGIQVLVLHSEAFGGTHWQHA